MTEINAKKTKVSFSIIGDAFADLFCLLQDGLPPTGGDKRVEHPMTPVAGGSGVNTATHLASLIRDFLPPSENENEDDGLMDVTLQTAINDKDYYGRVILDHAKEHSFGMINCSQEGVKATKSKSSGDENDNDPSANENKEISKATGHCIVLVNQGERSFVTHLGVNESFKASHTILHELVNFRTADPTFINHHHHIHVAGYYNLPGFSKGNLKKRLKLVREKRRAQSHGSHTFTTTISLVPQYDATEEWDAGLVEDVLPLVDFLILNALEAGKITKVEVEEKDCGGSVNRAVVFAKWAEYFWSKSPLTHVIVTLGSIGAVCFYQGEVVASMGSPKKYECPVDPTGAGDAFAAGFLFGIMNWRKHHGHEDFAEIGSMLEVSWSQAIIEGMRYGCCAGTACVSRPGASVPASKEELLKFLLGSDSDEDTSVEEEEGSKDEEESGEEESEDESYYPDQSDYDSSGSSEYYDSSSEGEDEEEVVESLAKSFEEKKLSN